VGRLQRDEQVGREDTVRTVELHRPALGMQPAMLAKVGADVGLEMDFLMQ
jgi:hypothetical protein